MKNIILLILCSASLFAQNWEAGIIDSSNFYSIREAYLQSQIKPKSKMELNALEYEEPETHFRRWEYMIEPRVYPNGKLPCAGYLLKEMNNFQQNNYVIYDTIRNGNWESIEFDNGFPVNGYSGRLNCIAFHPQDTNIIFVGSPSGGLWKTTDGGSSWACLTDFLPSLGVSEIVIDYSNPKIMYLATGDRDAAFFISNPYSYGLLKSTDGGISWQTTGLKHIFEDQMTIQRLIMHPTDPRILMAAVTGTNGNLRGIWRTTDEGETWKNVAGGGKVDVEFNPGDPNIVYCSGWKNIAKSTDAGLTWYVMSPTVLPSTDVTFSRIAVTSANPHLVTAQYQNQSTGTTYGLYKSWDDGANWTKVNSESLGTQGGYDWTLTVSNVDTNVILYGGQSLYGSKDGGITKNYLNSGHLDHHDMQYHPVTKALFNCNDGGLYKSYNNGKTWINLNKGLYTFQYYRMGNSASNENMIITGAQDNGTQLHKLPMLNQIGILADGMECIVDYTNENIYYLTYQYGYMTRFGQNLGTFTSPPDAGNSSKVAWVTPLAIHPNNPSILYFGQKDIYRTTNRGNSWTAYSNQLTAADGVGGGMIRTMATSESNPDSVLYAASYVVVYRTTDGGTTWKNITSNLPTTAGNFNSSAVSYICVHPENQDIAWVTMSGYNKENKVFKTTDGGGSWVNISANLPAVPVNCIVYQKKNNDAVYIGTDIGIFYRDNLLDKWIPFMNNLPNVPVQELEIHANSEKIRAATFGRGLWESNLYGKILSAKNNPVSDNVLINPNPATDYLCIDLSFLRMQEFKIRIFNIFGECMLSVETGLRPVSTRIDISSLPAGVYFVKIGEKVSKFIKIQK
jgi:hypothetical protein